MTVDSDLRDKAIREVLESIGSSFTFQPDKEGLKRGATNAVDNVLAMIGYERLVEAGEKLDDTLERVADLSSKLADAVADLLALKEDTERHASLSDSDLRERIDAMLGRLARGS